MSKFNDVTDIIFSVFGSVTWTTHLIPTYPQNFVNDNEGAEFVRISIITSSGVATISAATGIMKVEIYTPAGQSVDRAIDIVGYLNNIFENKTVNGIQFTSPAVAHLDASKSKKDEDVEDPTLFKSLYSIGFNHYGA